MVCGWETVFPIWMWHEQFYINKKPTILRHDTYGIHICCIKKKKITLCIICTFIRHTIVIVNLTFWALVPFFGFPCPSLILFPSSCRTSAVWSTPGSSTHLRLCCSKIACWKEEILTIISHHSKHVVDRWG